MALHGHTNGRRPMLSESYAAQARALIHRHETAVSRDELLAFVDHVMTRYPVEADRCKVLRERLLQFYAEFEAVFGEGG